MIVIPNERRSRYGHLSSTDALSCVLSVICVLSVSGCRGCEGPRNIAPPIQPASVEPISFEPLPVPAHAANAKASNVAFEVPQGFTILPDSSGLIPVEFAGAPVVGANWAFWRAGWQFSDTEVLAHEPGEDGLPHVRLKNEGFGLTWDARYTSSDQRTLEVSYDIQVHSSLETITGGGISFDLKPHPALVGEPSILPRGEGWTWRASAGGEVEVRFSPPLIKVHQEPGNPRNIRALIFEGRLKEGRLLQKMTVTLPSGSAVLQAGRPYAKPDSSWKAFQRDAVARGGGSDISFLNREHGRAGSHGRLQRDGDRLAFADGTPARFWGTNLTAYSLFGGSDEEVAALAQRLSSLGFNLVRLHHHDSSWVKPNIFGEGESTKSIDKNSFESIGRRVKVFAEHGIYTWLDIEVGRKYQREDSVTGFSEVAASDSRGFSYVNADLEAAWSDFAKQYLTRKNPHSGLSFAEDPAVVAVLLTNENDITNHFGNKMLPDKPAPVHTRLLAQRASDFSKKSPYSRDQLLRTWEPGPSKLFLADLEHSWFSRARALVEDLGVSALIATTNTWGNNPTFSLPSLTVGDLIDVHSYGEEEFLSKDPRTTPNFSSWIASAQVAGYPLSVTEWNVPYPARDRFAAPMYVASLASLQGWDMLMHYAYQQYSVGASPHHVDQWSSVDDPALITQMPAAALLFRRGDVAEAKNTFRLDLDVHHLYKSETSPETSAAIRTTFEQSRFVIGLPDAPELAWDTLPKPKDQKIITDPSLSLLAADATQVVSDTGQLIRSWVGGYQLIDTPRTQAATGWLGGREIELGDVTIELTTTKGALAVSSLDGKPLSESERILLTVTAQATAAQGLPFISEPVTGKISLRTVCSCFRPVLAEHQPSASPLTKSSAKERTGTITLSPRDFAHWYILFRPKGDSGRCL